MEIPQVEDLSEHSDDEAAIRAIVADTEKAFNTGDAELLVAHMARNTAAVGVTGAELAGRTVILDGARVAFAGRSGATTACSAESGRVRRGVACGSRSRSAA